MTVEDVNQRVLYTGACGDRMKVVMTCKVNLSVLRYGVEIIDGHVSNVSHAHVATYIVLNHPFLTPFLNFQKIIFDNF